MKRRQKQKQHVFHLRRVGLLSLLLMAFFVVRIDAGVLAVDFRNDPERVLAYATEMSRSGLLSGTNNARSANGLGGFTLNSQLNNSAQMKAEDMAAKNYWAHTAPDGTEPWYFFQQSGYDYIRAGENLAYGFSTSQSAVDGWMNSASHRANILGDFVEVGFGIVNVPSYQNEGQQTIVVAHYGSRAPAPAPTPAPIAPSPSTPSATPSAPALTPTAPSPITEQPTANTPSPDVVTPQPAEQTQQEAERPEEAVTAAPVAVKTGLTSRVSVLSMITHQNASIAAIVSLLMVSVAVLGYALVHRSAFQQAVTAGETFVATHPGIDAFVVSAITALILLTTYGNIS